MNTDNPFVMLAADPSESIKVEHGSLRGPGDTPIQQAGIVLTAIGASVDPRTYALFTPLLEESRRG
jgi:hypothetical protein